MLTLPKVAESLAGRMEVATLWPLSQGELAGHRETSTAASMSATRRRQSLGGTYRLRQDPVSNLGAQPATRHQIDLTSQESFEAVLNVE